MRPRRCASAPRSAAPTASSPSEDCGPSASVQGSLTRFLNSRRRMSALEVVPRIRAVERLVAEREVGHDVAFYGRLQQRPLKPRRVAQVTALDAPGTEAHVCEDIAAETLDERGALDAGCRRLGRREPDRSRRERAEGGPQPRDAALDLEDPH